MKNFTYNFTRNCKIFYKKPGPLFKNRKLLGPSIQAGFILFYLLFFHLIIVKYCTCSSLTTPTCLSKFFHFCHYIYIFFSSMKTTHRIFPPVNPPPPSHTQIIGRDLLRCVIQKAVRLNHAAVPLWTSMERNCIRFFLENITPYGYSPKDLLCDLKSSIT